MAEHVSDESTAAAEPAEGEAEGSGDPIVDYVEYVVQSLVDDPDAVVVEGSHEDGELFVDVEVAPDERGRVIGRGGRLIRSLRVVVRAAAGRDNGRASVELVEE